MKDYQLHEIKIEDYNQINEYYNLRRPETADSNILDLFQHGILQMNMD